MDNKNKAILRDKLILTININWAAGLALVAFWCYGFYGAISSAERIGVFGQTIVSFVLYSIFLLFLILWQKNK